jgi:hypothetical protein
MKLSGITCKECGVSYQVAEAASVNGGFDEAVHCMWDQPCQGGDTKLKALRLLIPHITNTQWSWFHPRWAKPV